MITQDELKQILHYDIETGIFIWKKKIGAKTAVGSVAGTISRGYRKIMLNYKLYSAHRLAWLYIYGEFPKDLIDHINGIKSDNRMCNLRQATQSQNLQNQKKSHKNSLTGEIGVHIHHYAKKKKFVAHIRVNGKQKTLGYFLTKKEASDAYLKAKRELHLFCTI